MEELPAGEEPVALALGSALRLLDQHGRTLQVLQHASDATLRFMAEQPSGRSRSEGSSATAGDVWRLAAARQGGPYTLQHAASGCFLTALDGQLLLTVEPQPLQLFMDLQRRVALCLPGKACLQSAACGAAVAGRLPLATDRPSKLFTLAEVEVPPHSLRAWPMRVALRCEEAAGYLSASGRALAAAAPVACCGEEFLLALGEAAPLAASSTTLFAPHSSVWTADGKCLLSHDAGTGQLVLAPQHGCTGGERFTLQLSDSGKLGLLAERAQGEGVLLPAADAPCCSGANGGSDAGSSCGSPRRAAGPEAPAPVPVVAQRHGVLAACAGGGTKPSKFDLELASHRPTLLLTAHGHLLGCQGQASSRPCGILPPASASPGAAPAAAAAGASAWLLHHHGDCVYSLRHAASGRQLYVDDLGAPCLDPPTLRGGGGRRVVYPDERLLFWVEPGWATPEAAGGSGAAAGPACFGVSLRSVHRVGGKHLYLSALPDGLVTTIYAAGRPSRWELFAAADLQTLVSSPLRLLEQLPCAPTPAPAPLLLRRATSMQVLSGGSDQSATCGSPPSPLSPLAGRQHSRGSLPRPPSLPAVQEHGPALGHAISAPVLAPVNEGRQQSGGMPPRRSQSETALAELQRAAPRQPRPLWLAQLLREPRQEEGWGLRSPACLQDLACRQLVAGLVRRYRQQHGGGWELPIGLVHVVEEELSAHLPEEVATHIGRELRLLAEPPAPTKLSLHSLASVAAVKGGGGGGLVPAWAAPFLEDQDGEQLAAGALAQWAPPEAHLCCSCRGGSGVQLPLDPYINPAHHLFLTAQERRARGGGRVRLRARRRLDQEDPVVALLRAGKVALMGLALVRTVRALVS